METLLEPSAIRAAMGAFTTGVTVIATRAAGERVGFTANSLTSVSVSPPTLLFCIGKSRASFAAIAAGDAFTVNILGGSQRAMSELFATSGGRKWDEIEHDEDRFGNPVLRGAAAVFSCRKTEVIDTGDHAIVLGAVEAFRQDREVDPLVFCRSRYCLPGEAA